MLSKLFVILFEFELLPCWKILLVYSVNIVSSSTFCSLTNLICTFTFCHNNEILEFRILGFRSKVGNRMTGLYRKKLFCKFFIKKMKKARRPIVGGFSQAACAVLEGIPWKVVEWRIASDWPRGRIPGIGRCSQLEESTILEGTVTACTATDPELPTTLLIQGTFFMRCSILNKLRKPSSLFAIKKWYSSWRGEENTQKIHKVKK